jgi:hypothetical protein
MMTIDDNKVVQFRIAQKAEYVRRSLIRLGAAISTGDPDKIRRAEVNAQNCIVDALTEIGYSTEIIF